MSILQNKFNQVETNIQGGVDFKVTANAAHIFALLSDTLYSDKELAVVHEISANAVDAHQMIGRPDLPIKVTGPTLLEPSLSIRDYGPGLNEVQVKTLLTTYGESGEHKRTSNDYLGCWGIGAKSPAAVSNNWKIISYHGGEKRTYIVLIQANGVPQLNQLPKVEVTSETGLEVIIPVNPSKLASWNAALASAYTFYNVKPVANFEIDVVNLKKPTSFTSDVCFIPDRKYIAKRIGCIVNSREYFLDLNKIISAVPKTSPICNSKFLIENMNMCLTFCIGEIMLDMSRENIQYTHHSINSIITKLEQIHADIKREFDKIENESKNSIEYRVKVSAKIASFDIHVHPERFVEFFADNKYGIKNISGLENYCLFITAENCSFKSKRKKTVSKPSPRPFYYREWAPADSIEVIMPQSCRDVSKGIVHVVLSHASNLVIMENKIYNAMFRATFNYPNHDILLISPEDYAKLSSELDFLKVDIEKLPKPSVKPRDKTAPLIETKVYCKRGPNSFQRCDVTKFASEKCFYYVVNKMSSSMDIPTNDKKIINTLEEIGYTALYVKNKDHIPAKAYTISTLLEQEKKYWTPEIIETQYMRDFFFGHSFNINRLFNGINDFDIYADKQFKKMMWSWKKHNMIHYPVHPIFKTEMRLSHYEALNNTVCDRNHEKRSLDFYTVYPMLKFHSSSMKPEMIVQYVNMVDSFNV